MSWPPCATPRSMSADSPDTPTSPPPNATTAGHPTPPSTPSSPHDQLDHRSSAPFHDLAMPLGRRWVPPPEPGRPCSQCSGVEDLERLVSVRRDEDCRAVHRNNAGSSHG